MGKSKPGDGSAWKPIGGFDRFWRSAYQASYAEHTWLIDVDFFDIDERVRLYRDGVQHQVGTSPVRFELDDAWIDADMGTYGMKRAHLVTPTGANLLAPAPRTLEHSRLDLARRAPRLSRGVAVLAVLILIVALILQVPQLVDWVTHTEWFGRWSQWSFTSPWWLGGPVNVVVSVLAVLAALERGLSMRYSRWLDG